MKYLKNYFKGENSILRPCSLCSLNYMKVVLTVRVTNMKLSVEVSVIID